MVAESLTDSRAMGSLEMPQSYPTVGLCSQTPRPNFPFRPAAAIALFDKTSCFRSDRSLKKGGGGILFFSGGNTISKLATCRYHNRYL